MNLRKNEALKLRVEAANDLQIPGNNSHPGETCWKLEQGWFWDEGAKPVFTAGQIVHEIHTAHSRNANFLLNAGPDKQGRIIDASRKAPTGIPVSRKDQP